MSRLWAFLNKVGAVASLLGLLVVLVSGAVSAMAGLSSADWRLFYCVAFFAIATLCGLLMVHLCWQRLLPGPATPTGKAGKPVTTRYVVAGLVVLLFTLVIGVCLVGIHWALSAKDVWTPPFFQSDDGGSAIAHCGDYLRASYQALWKGV